MDNHLSRTKKILQTLRSYGHYYDDIKFSQEKSLRFVIDATPRSPRKEIKFVDIIHAITARREYVCNQINLITQILSKNEYVVVGLKDPLGYVARKDTWTKENRQEIENQLSAFVQELKDIDGLTEVMMYVEKHASDFRSENETTDNTTPPRKKRKKIALKDLARLVYEEKKKHPEQTDINISTNHLKKYEVIGKPGYSPKQLAKRVSAGRDKSEWED